MKKIFILAGELSGDKTASWYLEKLTLRHPCILRSAASRRKGERGMEQDRGITCEAVGGDFLKNAGAKIYERFENLNVTGVIEILKHLRFIFKFLNEVSNYILQNNFDEVVLVDFPGFNLRLAKKLKRKNPNIKITYLSPPQLWAWGAWRIKTLKNFCDDIIVLYPFEVDWYKKRNVNVKFIGNPVFDDVKPYLEASGKKENKVVIMPGSRTSEIEKLLPLFIDIAKRFKSKYPEVDLYLPLSESIEIKNIEKKLKSLNAPPIKIIVDQKEKFEVLSRSVMAISKPGTVSLQLALLSVPSVILYKANWLTAFLARRVVNIKYMSLPNLILDKPVFKEFLQQDCKPDLIFDYSCQLYESCLKKDLVYKKLQNDFKQIREIF